MRRKRREEKGPRRRQENVERGLRRKYNRGSTKESKYGRVEKEWAEASPEVLFVF